MVVKPPCKLRAAGAAPVCLRCGTVMVWIHSSWQCSACKFKEGCCG